MVDMPERLDLAELGPEQIAPLEALMDQAWSDTWRELATSQYITLLSEAPAGKDIRELARLAVVLTLGIAQDLGGTQPYIPVGAMLAASAKAKWAIELRHQGKSYKQVADATGLTEKRVRQIETEWRRAEMAARQGRLQLD